MKPAAEAAAGEAAEAAAGDVGGRRTSDGLRGSVVDHPEGIVAVQYGYRIQYGYRGFPRYARQNPGKYIISGKRQI